MKDQADRDRERERRKSTKSAKSAVSGSSNASVLKRWRRYVAAFPNIEHSDNGIPPLPTSKFSETGNERWPQALASSGPVKTRPMKHTRFASSQAISNADHFRFTYGVSSADNDGTASSTRSSVSMESPRQSSEAARYRNAADTNGDHDEIGLATQRRSKRYSGRKSPMSPMSPSFGFGTRDRKADEQGTKSILKRESIMLSALPSVSRNEGMISKNESTRRSFPAGHGWATFVSTSQRSPRLNDGFVFPRPLGAGVGMRSSLTPTFVGWNGMLDPARPENRPTPIKLVTTVLLVALAFTVTFASAVLTPASLQISRAFETTPLVITLASALTVLGFAFGAPLYGALSEKLGRKRPLLVGLAFFALLHIPIAISGSLPVLLVFRFLTGLCGAAPLVIVPAIFADLWSPVGRGIALSFFTASTVIGPVVGAIVASFLADVDYPCWRWTVCIVVGLSVCFGLPAALIYGESCESVLMRCKASGLRSVTRDVSFRAETEYNAVGFGTHLKRMALLLAEPSLLLPTVHMSFACGLINLLFVSYGYAFRKRHWQSSIECLPLLPIILGACIGIFINFTVSKKKYTAVYRRDGSVAPEARLIPWIIGSWILPIGLLVFAWTSSPDVTVVPQFGAGVSTGIGTSLILIGCLNYIVDTYVDMRSLAVAASTCVHSAIAFACPLLAHRMFEALGVGLANTTLAVVAIVLIPIPISLMKLGPRLRTKCRFAVKPQGFGHGSRANDGAEMAGKNEAFSITIEGGPRTIS